LKVLCCFCSVHIAVWGIVDSIHNRVIQHLAFVSFQQRKIESYREEQKNGKDLNSDQLAAVAKYEEVQQTLEFARDLCKQFNGIAVDAAKQLKKQARKEALEKNQQDLAKVKEILVVQVSLLYCIRVCCGNLESWYEFKGFHSSQDL
jgi:hypothetical protein